MGFQGLASDSSQLPAIDLSLRSRLTGAEISGYLGLDLLERSRILVDTRTRRISLGPPD